MRHILRAGIFFSLFLLATAWTMAAPTRMYISDHLQVLLRSDPSAQADSLATLSTGALLTILDDTTSETWVKVAAPDGKQGWLLKRYLVADPPAALRLKNMEPEDRLTKRLEDLRREHQEVKTQLSQAETSLSQLQDSYQKLKDDTVDMQKLQAEHQQLLEEFESQSQELAQLASDNESMRFATNLRWFLAGGGMLLLGWLMGAVFGRRKKNWPNSLR